MADSVEQSKWGKFIGETTAITVVGSVLYFWGRAYTSQLIRSSEFPSELFEVPLYDVLFTSWLPVFFTLLSAVVIGSVWYARHLWAILICAFLITFVRPLLVGLRKITPDKWLKSTVNPKFSWLRCYLNWLKRYMPEGLIVRAESGDNSLAEKCVVTFIVLSSIFAGGAFLEKKAQSDFAKKSAASEKRLIGVTHQDGKETIGQQVVSLGGNVILDVTDAAGQINRVLIRGTDIKQVTQLPPPAPKEPSISAAPVTK